MSKHPDNNPKPLSESAILVSTVSQSGQCIVCFVKKCQNSSVKMFPLAFVFHHYRSGTVFIIFIPLNVSVGFSLSCRSEAAAASVGNKSNGPN